MKNLKKPTRNQKEFMKKNGLDFTAYLVKEDNENELIVVDKVSGEAKCIEKRR